VNFTAFETIASRADSAANGDAISVQPVLDPHAALVRPRPQHADAGSHHHAKLDDFIRQMLFRILSVITADPGALLGFLNGRFDWFAHLERHQAAEFLLLVLENLRDARQPARAFSESRAAKFFREARRALEFLVEQKLGLRLHLGGDVATGSR
jgi:hypothetical protein